MLSGTIVLDGESTDRFLSLVAALHEEFQPQTPFEESLIENMAAARWRQMRIWGIEKAGMDHETRRQAGMAGSAASTEDNATRAALAFRALSDESRSLDELIHRYDTRYERQYYRAHRRFLEVRDRRTPPSNEPDHPNQPSGDGTFLQRTCSEQRRRAHCRNARPRRDSGRKPFGREKRNCFYQTNPGSY